MRSPQLEQKQQYARWKAADIAKALKEGRTPTPGPRECRDVVAIAWADVYAAAGEENDDLDNGEPPTSEAAGSPSESLPRLPDLPASPPENPPPTSSGPSFPPAPQDRDPTQDTWSTVGTPGTTQPADPDTAFHLPSAPTTINQTITRRASGGLRRASTSSTGEKKEVRFAGMDGAPLSPGATVVSLDSYVAPDAPPPSAFEESEPEPHPDVTSTSENLDKDTPPTPHLPSTPASLPPPTLPSAPSTNPFPQPPPSAPPAPPPPQPAFPTELDSKSIERCQKHARWAISALDYEDLETARKELRLALDLLEGR